MANPQFVKKFNDLSSYFNKLAHEINEPVKQAVYEEALVLYNQSTSQVAVDTGRLRASGLIEDQSTAAEANFKISFDPTAIDASQSYDYAPKEDRRTGFFSNAVEAVQQDFEKRISDRIDQLIKR